MREQGFYYVKNFDQWSICYWDGDNWMFVNSENKFCDSDHDEIDELKIDTREERKEFLEEGQKAIDSKDPSECAYILNKYLP